MDKLRNGTFRAVHTSFWDDTFIEQLTWEEKYFYLFLMTNPLTTELGIYEITPKKMHFYTGFSIDTVEELIQRFQEYGKIIYNRTTSEICLLNKVSYIFRGGKPTEDCLITEMSKVKDKNLIKAISGNVKIESLKKLFIDDSYNDSLTIRGQQQQQKEQQHQQQLKEEQQYKDIVQNEILNDIDFNKFWDLYDKKVSREKSFKLWIKLKAEEKEKIFQTLPNYIESTPDIKFRKNPDTYLRNKSWEDEIIKEEQTTSLKWYKIPPDDEPTELHPIQEYIKVNCPRISELPKQLSFEEAETLAKKYRKESIKSILQRMENYNKLRNYTSVYLTIDDWIKKESDPYLPREVSTLFR